MKLQLEKQSPQPLELYSQCDHELFSLIARNGNIQKREKNFNFFSFFLERAKRIHNVWRWQDMKENFLQAEATHKKEGKKDPWLQNIGRASRLCSLTNLFSLLCARTEAKKKSYFSSIYSKWHFKVFYLKTQRAITPSACRKKINHTIGARGTRAA